MRVAGFFLADAVQVHPDGRLNVLGGWPEYWWVGEVPYSFVLPVAFVVEADDTTSTVPLRLQIEAVSDGGVGTERLVDERFELGVSQRTEDLAKPGAPIYRTGMMMLTFAGERVGGHVLRLLDATTDLEVARIKFSIVLRA